MSTNIMIVDDEKDIADLVQIYLENDGFNVFKFYNAKDALECAMHENLDLAILDVMLPDIDGFTILKKRQPGSTEKNLFQYERLRE